MNKMFKLKDLLLAQFPVGSPGSLYTLIYKNEHKVTKTIDEITEKEFNTYVSNVFAIGFGRFQIHLHKLGEVEQDES